MNDELKNLRSKSRWSAIGWLLISSFILLPSSLVLADSFFVGSLETKNVVIKELKDGNLIYEINGRQNEREAARISRLVVTNETPLNTAEEAYSLAKWDEAVDGYQKVLRTTNKPWAKDWAAMRLIESANKTGRFDAAATAYILALLNDPNAAAGMKPELPESKSTYLDTAVKEVNAALADSKLSVEQRRALLGFLVELQQARKDAAAEDAAYEQLARLPGADVNDPNARRVLARRRLSVASRALESRNYRAALDEISTNRAMFVEPAQQAEALFIIAEAQAALAESDPVALKDAALAYMRVVALAKDEPDRPRVVLSLIKTASILERVGDPTAATLLYEQVMTQYPDDPSSPKARENLERLRKPTAQN